MKFICSKCGKEFSSDKVLFSCDKCKHALIYSTNYDDIKDKISFSEDNSFWRYSSLMPYIDNKYRISLGEGRTPLFRAINLGSYLGLNNFFLKDETRNPTNSFRDRAASLLISHARSLKLNEVICASNGNLGAAIAAYCARANIKATIITPKKVDIGKLSQMKIYDANIVPIGETVDDAIEFVLNESEKRFLYQATSGLNPLIIEAQKTISYEISEKVGVPDFVVVPMGDGGTLYSIWKGFKEFYDLGVTSKLPKMIGVQSEKCAPIVEAYSNNRDLRALDSGDTNALGILVLNPLNGELALSVIRESKGIAISVSDQDIINAQKLLAAQEGIFAELSSCAAISAISKLIAQGFINTDGFVTCLVTGSGLKDPYLLAALTQSSKQVNLNEKVNLKLQILRLISLGETYGYALWNSLSRSVTIQAIYQHLLELESKNLIKSKEKEKRKYYTITNSGLRVLRALEELSLLL